MEPGVDLHIIQLLGKGTVVTTWLRIHPHVSRMLTEQLNTVAKKGSQKVRTRQPLPL
jgi:DNA-binding HxlR family transcriptional regulator